MRVLLRISTGHGLATLVGMGLAEIEGLYWRLLTLRVVWNDLVDPLDEVKVRIRRGQ